MQRNHKATLAAALFTLVGASSIAGAQQAKNEEKFCSELSTLRSDVAKVQSMRESGNTQQLRAAIDQTKQAAKRVEKEARNINTPTAKQFTQAADRLSTEAKNLPANMTVEQMHAKLDPDIQNVKRSAHKLAAESGCPGAMGGQHETGTPGYESQQPGMRGQESEPGMRGQESQPGNPPTE